MKKQNSQNLRVPRPGVEPGHPKIPDFESGASTNSAIWA